MSKSLIDGMGWDSMGRTKRFLVVVDGDNNSLYYTGILLQKLEYTIFTTRTAEEALDIIAIKTPALVLTEATLPGMSGLELLKQLKQTPRTKAVPVIIYTGSKDPALKEACQREGCDGYLPKPSGPEALYAAIQQTTETTPRNYIRLNTCLPMIVGYDSAAGEALPTGDCITALSENGMYVRTEMLRPVGALIPMTILLNGQHIKVEGVVLYSYAAGKGPSGTAGMGIKFTRISAGDRDSIRLFIGKQLTHDADQ